MVTSGGWISTTYLIQVLLPSGQEEKPMADLVRVVEVT